MISSSTVITEMTVAQARHALADTISTVWADGGLPYETLDRLNSLTDSLVEALVATSREDDLNLSDGPLETISGAVNATVLRSARRSTAADTNDLIVAVYEALIDAGHLPGVNAQKVAEPEK